ncbi:MAG: SEC-C metal-binding domain-containing protein, partial [Anaerovoracaceae bacterium]
LRNAIGHNDVEYDAISQEITYTPDPRERAKQERTYLLEFENEAVHVFQAITVISEYLYRLKEIEMIKRGHIPLPVASFKKVGSNEPCPCGSGLKYKKCHSR